MQYTGYDLNVNIQENIYLRPSISSVTPTLQWKKYKGDSNIVYSHSFAIVYTVTIVSQYVSEVY